jgi:hypothetical protein
VKNVAKPNLGKNLAQGEKVTVRTTLDRVRYWKASLQVNVERRQAPSRSCVQRGRVVKPWKRGAQVKLLFPDGGWIYERIFRRDEGTVWVRGWDTEEALAMIVGEALR